MGTRCTRRPKSKPLAVRAQSGSLASVVDVERDEGATPSLLDGLFNATQRRLFAYLFSEPERAFHVRELLALTGGGHGATQRELGRLERAGLVEATSDGWRTYVKANPKSPICDELVAMVRKTTGLAEPLRHAFQALAPHVALAFAFEPPRDPWVPDERDLGFAIYAGEHGFPKAGLDYGRGLAEQRLCRSIWMVDFDAERLRADPFIAQLLNWPRVWVFGGEAGLAELRATVAGEDLATRALATALASLSG